ncbi:MAG: hypothetical protein AB1782_01885 [Cyanobacteriota bacterium]
MKNRGQNLIEMAIIFALVVICAVVVLTALGKNINTMFSKSNEQYTEFKPFGSGETISYYDLKGYPVIESTQNNDGSTTFVANGQTVTIPKELADVIDTQGSSGDIMREIAYLIDKYGGDYAGDVPVQVFTGTSFREDDKMTANGRITEVTTNYSTIIQVGDHLVMLQSEDSCLKVDGKECGSGELNRLGDFRLEGDIINGKFVANVERTDEDSKVVKEMSDFKKDQDKLKSDLDKTLASLQADLLKAQTEGNTGNITKIQEKIDKENSDYQTDLNKLTTAYDSKIISLQENNRATITYAVDKTDGYNFTYESMDTSMRGVDRKKLEAWNIDFNETGYNL